MFQNQELTILPLLDITGRSPPDPLELTTCHPTNRGNYSLALIDQDDMIIGDTVTDEMKAYGITPILTVFGSMNLATVKTNDQSSSMNFTCVKPRLVVSRFNVAINQGTRAGSVRVLAILVATTVTSVLGGYFW